MTMNAYLNSRCHELWRGFAGAFCGRIVQAGMLGRGLRMRLLSSDCHELWASFRRLRFVE